METQITQMPRIGDNAPDFTVTTTTGEKVIVPALKTLEALAERKASDLEMVDWYLAKKSL